jgi:hypothetical protein
MLREEGVMFEVNGKISTASLYHFLGNETTEPRRQSREDRTEKTEPGSTGRTKTKKKRAKQQIKCQDV